MDEDDDELGPVVSVDIDHSVQLLLKSEKEAKNHSKHHQGSIFMVPSVYRRHSPDSYTPQVVSIGPLHHGDEHLKGFEVQKATYMHNLLHTISGRDDSKTEQILKECVTKVSGSMDRIKACYVGMKRYTESELVKMMVMDACFILAFVCGGFSIGQSTLLFPHIFSDMVLIENQIPFFVLHDIFDCTFLKYCPKYVTLSKIIFQVAHNCRILEQDLVMADSSISSTHDHILVFLHKSYQNPDSSDPSTGLKKLKAHSAVELDRSGIRFSNKLSAKSSVAKERESGQESGEESSQESGQESSVRSNTERDAEWLMAMELKHSRFLRFPLSWSKPTLKMPVLRLYDETESIIRNLIIYEQSAGVKTCVTSYMKVMDMLIDTPEDVAKLVKSQVLDHYLGSDEKVANLINSMLKEVVVKDFYYEDVWKKMDDHYNARWPKLIAELRRNYFSKPWSIIALLVGFALFVLTVVQTVYGVKAA